MGVRGLTTYISERADQYMECINLSNCYIVIDGNSLAAQLYNHTPNTNCAFGGDYNKYALCVLEFFRMLQACSIKPLVVFDGGYERVKLSTVEKRFKDRIHGAVHQNPTVHKKHFPLMYKEVLKDILNDLEVPLAQSLFEADEEIAAIARHLNCPVVSYDSDFFIYDVDYIPFPTIEWRVHEEYPLRGSYLKCSKFKVESFLHHKGLKKEILPFLAVTLGNDYISRSVFQHFVTHLKRTKSKKRGETKRNISGLLEWLKYETLESAVTKVTETLPKNKRIKVLRKMNKIIALYKHCSSDLLPHLGIDKSVPLGISSEKAFSVVSLSDSEEAGEMSESEEEGEMEVDEESGENCGDDAESGEKVRRTLPLHKKTALKLPDWTLNYYQAGSLTSMFMDMVTLNVYFIPPQVEEIDLDCSHIVSLPIIRILYGLLSTSGLMRGSPLVCHIRGKQSIRKVNVYPSFKAGNFTFPQLEFLVNLPLEVRKQILCDVLGISDNDYENVKSVPIEWLLFVMIVIYWVRNTQAGVNSCHVLALMCCFLTLTVVDQYPQTGLQEKMLTDETLSDSNISDVNQYVSGSSSNCQNAEEKSTIKEHFKDSLAALCANDYMLLSKAVSTFREVDQKLKSSPRAFSASIVHVFAEFQSCLVHTRYLNALLGLPFPKCSPHLVFNGTFLYNMYTKLRKKPQPMAYIEHLFSCVPSFLVLLKSLFDLFCNLLPALKAADELKKGRKKRKRRSQGECGDMDDLAEIVKFIEG